MEEWKDVRGYEGLYKVSNFGMIYDCINDKYPKHYLYGKVLTVRLYNKDGKGKTVCLPKLIASAFVPNPNNLTVVDYKDGDYLNSIASNLYWRDKVYVTPYFSRDDVKLSDEEVIDEWVEKYREEYPDDDIEDEDLRQDLRLKMVVNANKGLARTMHFKTEIGFLHSRYKNDFKNSIESYDELDEDMLDEDIEDNIDNFEINTSYIDKMMYFIDNTLTPRESFVIKFRYGLLSNAEYERLLNKPIYNHSVASNRLTEFSLGETSDILCVTRERIRQIEMKAFRKLRHPSRLGRYICKYEDKVRR